MYISADGFVQFPAGTAIYYLCIVRLGKQLLAHQNMLDNEAYFIRALQPFIISACKKEKTKVDMQQVKFIDSCISQEYFTERNWAS